MIFFKNAKKIGFIFIALLPFFLSGCNHLSPFCTKPLEIECTDIQRAVNCALQTPSFCEGDLPPLQWWYFFEDSKLNSLIEQAIAYNPSMDVAKSRIRLANYESNYTRSTLLPHFYSLFGLTRRKSSRFASNFNPIIPGLFTETTVEALCVDYQIDLWMKNRKLYYAALDELQVNVAEEKETFLLLTTAVAQTYFDLQASLIRLEIASKLYQTQESLYQLNKEQFDRGLISQFSVYEIDLQKQLTLEAIEQFKNDIEMDRHALIALVGGQLDPCIPLCETISLEWNAPFPLPCSLPLELLSRRPDIVAQKWSIESMAYKIGAAQAAFYPNLNLMAYIGFRSVFINELFTDRASDIIGSLLSTIPWFEGGRLRANLGISQENFEIAVGEYNKLVLQAVQETTDFISSLITADNKLKIADTALNDANQLFGLTKQKFDSGIDNLLNVLKAKQLVLAEEDTKAVIALAKFQAAIGLIRAIGGGYDRPA